MHQLHSQLQTSEQQSMTSEDMQYAVSTPTHSLLSILPLEIAVIILRHSPSLATLSARVHSSAHYHNAYLIGREEVLTAVTLRELDVQRGISSRKPCHFMTYALYAGALQFGDSMYPPSPQTSVPSSPNEPGSSKARRTNAKPEKEESETMRALFQQLNSPQPLRLRVSQCIALLSLRGVRQFWIANVPDELEFWEHCKYRVSDLSLHLSCCFLSCNRCSETHCSRDILCSSMLT